ncbi:hypothetical protein PBV88_53855, partial [Streptomyces sp. T21Q-yed]|nr:hypothetical protein [Streptomyces sp. T21Q-yed]
MSAFLSAARSRVLRTAVVPALGAALLVSLLPAQASALPPDPAKDEVPREELTLEKLPEEELIEGTTANAGLDRIEAAPPTEQVQAPAGTTTPPAGGDAVVSFSATTAQSASYQRAASTAKTANAASTASTTDPQSQTRPAAFEPAGALPVKLGQAPGAAMPAGDWGVKVYDRTETPAQGVDGAVVTVTAPAGGSVPVSVQLDYKAYQNLYGADWASRLTFVQFPECYLTSPDLDECRTYEELETVNDTRGKTITATVDTAADGTVTPASAPSAPSAPA